MINIKEGVIIKKFNLPVLTILTSVIKTWKYFAPLIVPVVTAGSEKIPLKDRPITSLHYQHKALDFRTRDLSHAMQEIVAKHLQFDLGKDYDVVLEKTHIHIEHQPKGVSFE